MTDSITSRNTSQILRWSRRSAAAAGMLCLAGLLLVLSGCARGKAAPGDRDPYQKYNRKVMGFNDRLDQFMIKPVATTYIAITPKFFRTGVRNFFDNMNEIGWFINSFLQGRGKNGFTDMGRFAINSTVGIVGIIDVAKHIGLQRHEQDLGITLAVWGCGEGNYYILPLLGPSTTRDNPWQVIQVVLGVTSFPWSMIDLVSQRADAEDDLNTMDKMAVDRYVFLREAYRQHRAFMIYDGPPPVEDLTLDDPLATEAPQEKKAIPDANAPKANAAPSPTPAPGDAPGDHPALPKEFKPKNS